MYWRLIALIVLVYLGISTELKPQIFLTEVYDSISIIEDEVYGYNYSVLHFPSKLIDTLRYDLYQPVSGGSIPRPLVILLHTGNFIPLGFIAPYGVKNDYANVQLATRLARRGYVAVNIEYRLGWNPLLEEGYKRRESLFQAIFRAIQDVYTAIRYFRKSVELDGNPYYIDTERIALFGIGTGGIVAMNTWILDSVEQLYIPKLSDPISGQPFIDTLVFGDLYGEKEGTFNMTNHPGFCNDFQYVYTLDGALVDTSWLYSGTRSPLTCAGVKNNPVTPFGIDPITGKISCILPSWGYPWELNMNFAGSACVISHANALGFNESLDQIPYLDTVSQVIRSLENAQEHLWPIHLPGEQIGPWNYWDSIFWNNFPVPGIENLHEIGLRTNPDMSMDKANRYIDTALWFFSPRAVIALGLDEEYNNIIPGCDNLTYVQTSAKAETVYRIAPNPTNADLSINVDSGFLMSLKLFDSVGNILISLENLNLTSTSIDLSDFPPGVYLLQLEMSEKKVFTSKVVKVY